MRVSHTQYEKETRFIPKKSKKEYEGIPHTLCVFDLPGTPYIQLSPNCFLYWFGVQP